MPKRAGSLLVLIVVFAAACGDRPELRRDQQQYEVVQEGAAGGVTGTLQAPGETLPPVMPPLTGTSADTTTAFNLPGVSATTTTTPAPPGSIAGTLPQDPAYPAPPRPRPVRPRPEPVPETPPTATQPPTETAPAEEPRREEEPRPDEPRQPEPQPAPQPVPPPSEARG